MHDGVCCGSTLLAQGFLTITHVIKGIYGILQYPFTKGNVGIFGYLW